MIGREHYVIQHGLKHGLLAKKSNGLIFFKVTLLPCWCVIIELLASQHQVACDQKTTIAISREILGSLLYLIPVPKL